MSHRRPTLQQLWPSPSMGRSAAPPTHGAAAPYIPTLTPHLVPLLRVTKSDPSKNREMLQALALGGCPFIGRHNNRPRVSFCKRLEVGEEVCCELYHGTLDVCMVNKVHMNHSMCKMVDSVYNAVETQQRVF
jgi:hypothetical protein